MSLASEVNNSAIDNLVESSLESENEDLRLKWIPYEGITNVKPTQIDNVYYAICNEYFMMFILLGSDETCTLTLVSEFARIYSLLTRKYNKDDNQFKRYSLWLENRNKLIKGFTKYDDNYYMVADKRFYYYYSRYGFCIACGILRCSPLWCICGHKQLCDGWTSNNKQLDEFIKKSQLQANSPNDVYLEWIPFDWIDTEKEEYGYVHICGLPTRADIKSIPLEITDEPHDLYYVEVNYLLMCHVY